jgi:hypothetical protein
MKSAALKYFKLLDKYKKFRPEFYMAGHILDYLPHNILVIHLNFYHQQPKLQSARSTQCTANPTVFNTLGAPPSKQAMQRMANARFAVPRHEGVSHTLHRRRLQTHGSRN